MLGRIFGVMVILATAAAAILGREEALGGAVLDAVSGAVSLTLSLAGMMCFWSGVMAVLREAGVIRGLSRLMRPLIRFFFPDAWASGEGVEDICANVSANLLGLGNAATPMALRAMHKLQSINPEPDRASGDMITLTVLNTASVSIVPSTIIVMREEAGSANPFAVVGAVWITSFCSAAFALLLTRGFRGARVRRAGAERASARHRR